MAMSEARHKQIMSTITATAGKVYGVVPMADRWSVKQIVGELVRTGVRFPHDAVCGCLDSLRRTGLISENRDGFQRVAVREKPTLADLKTLITAAPPEENFMSLPTNTPTPPMPAVKPPALTRGPMPLAIVDTITALSQEMAAMSLRHQKEMADMAEHISNMAIEVQGLFEGKEEQLQQFSVLKGLLKSIGA